MGYTENIIERYKKVCALAEKGSEGEADNAQRIKKRMEEKHPGIALEAFPPKKKKSRTSIFDDSDLFEESHSSSSAMWETFTEKAGDFFSKVKDFTYSAMGIQRAKDLAGECKFKSRDNSSSVTVTCRIPDEVLDRVYYMSEEEKFAFMEEAAQYFADELATHLYDDEEVNT